MISQSTQHYKVCTKCRENKPIKDFSERKDRKSGYRSECKNCQNITSERWRKNNRSKFLNSVKEASLKRAFNISLNEYKKLFKDQKGLCAICNKKEQRKIGNKICDLSVDHDHKTGKVRGLLCNQCNNGIGRFKDNITYLEKAIDYLKRRS